MLNSYNSDAYKKLVDPIRMVSDIARRQTAKNHVLIPSLFRYFYPRGSVLELDAGVGQLSKLISDYGYKVVASDYHQFFVDHMRNIGLEAYRVDATNIAEAGLGEFDTIFTQSISPLTTCELDIVERTYASMYDALAPGGRIVMIHALCTWREIETRAGQHVGIASKSGLENVRTFRTQVMPSGAYRLVSASLSNGLEEWLGRRWGTSFVLLAEKPAPPYSWSAYGKEAFSAERCVGKNYAFHD